jgi:hypothetical protein
VAKDALLYAKAASHIKLMKEMWLLGHVWTQFWMHTNLSKYAQGAFEKNKLNSSSYQKRLMAK